MGAVTKMEIADVLRIEGIDANGYGNVPKFVMTDHGLSYKAKAIYAYLCAQAGDGITPFPSRDKIIHALGMSKTTYYNYFKELTDFGYIIVTKAPSTHGRFSRNIYTLVQKPLRLQQIIAEKGSDAVRSQLITDGLKGGGYGSVPRTVMDDPRLSIKAKVLYAYLSSFAGGGNTAFPKQKDLVYHIGFSVTTYQRALLELVKANYIEPKQQTKNGRFSRCDYLFIVNPDDAKGQAEIDRRNAYQQQLLQKQKEAAAKKKTPLFALPSTQEETIPPQKESVQNKDTVSKGGSVQNRDAVKTIAAEGLAESVQNKDTEKGIGREGVWRTVQKWDTVKWDAEGSDTVKPDVVKSDTVNRDNTINSPSKNSFTNINLSISKSTIPVSYELETFDDLETDDEKWNYICSELLQLDCRDDLALYDGEQIKNLISIVVECGHRKSMTIQGKTVERTEYMNRFLGLMLEEYQYVIDSVAKREGEIRNLRAYYIVSLFNAHNSYALQMEREVKQSMLTGEL